MNAQRMQIDVILENVLTMMMGHSMSVTVEVEECLKEWAVMTV